jgi:GTP-binding protein
VLSAVTGEGVKDALFALTREIARAKKADTAQTEKPAAPWRP